MLALASIYNEEEFRRSESTQGGEIQLCLELAKDFKIYLKGEGRYDSCTFERVHSSPEAFDEFRHGVQSLFL